MASLFNTKISNTYVGLLKMSDNLILSSSLREISDGSGNGAGVYLNTSGDLKATGILEFGSLKDTGESITISKFVDEADGIANNDNDTTIPTSAAIVDYVASRITLEDLDFSGDSGTGSVDLDSQVFAITGTTNQIETTASGQGISFSFPSAGIVLPNGSTATTQSLNDNSTKIATTAYVDASVDTVDTLSEILAVGNTTGGTNIAVSANDDITFTDTSKAIFGDGNDLSIYHTANSFIYNTTGDLVLEQTVNDQDIVFKSDDGSGGTTEYYKLDGSTKENYFSEDIKLIDSKILKIGSSSDFQFYHNTADSWIENYTGNINIRNRQDDGDIVFYSDDGSGGHAQYFRVDGGAVETQFVKSTLHYDNVKAQFGDGRDLEIYHDGTHSYIKDNGTGNLKIQASTEINLQATSGESFIDMFENGAVNLYYDNSLKLSTAAGGVNIAGNLNMNSADGYEIRLGSSNDLKIYHDGSNSIIADTGTGDLRIAGNVVRIRNAADTENMISCVQDGAVTLAYDNTTKLQTTSAGITVTGSLSTNSGSGTAILGSHLDLGDNQKARFGASQDLQIYHDGTKSVIEDTGTGDLHIIGDNDIVFKDGSGNILANMNAINSVELNFAGSNKFATTSTGINVTGITDTDGITSSAEIDVNLASEGTYFEGGSGNIRRLTITSGTNTSAHALHTFNINSSNGKYKFDINGTEEFSIDSANASLGGNLTIAGDLTVNGTTTTVNTQTLAVEDPLISLAKDNSANSVDIGFYGRYNDGTDRYLGIFSNASDDNKFVLFKGLTEEPTTTVNVSGTGFARGTLLLDSLGATGQISTTSTDGLLIDTGGNALINLDGASGSTQGIIIKHSGTEVSRISHSNSTDLIISTGSSVTQAIKVDSSQNTTIFGDLTLSAAGSTGQIIKTTDNTEPYFALQRNSANNGTAVLRLFDGGDLAFDTGATGAGQGTRMLLDASGNLGISTVSPDALLDIGVNNIITLDDTGSHTGFIGMGSYNDGSINRAQGASYYGFGLEIDRPNALISFNSYASSGKTAGGTNIIAMKRTGEVGIGTDSASTRLVVKSIQDASFDEGIGVERSNSSQTGYINMVGGAMNINAPDAIPIKFRDGGNTNVTIGGDGITTFANNILIPTSAGAISGSSYPYTTYIGSTANATTTHIQAGSSDKTEIKLYGGDVGDKIEFTTNATVQATLVDTGRLGLGTGTPNDVLNIHSSATDANLGLKITRGSQNHGLRLGVNDSHAFLWTDQAQNLVFATNDTQRFMADSSGNFMVGNTVTNPASGFASQKGIGYAQSTGQVQMATTGDNSALELGRNNAADGSILTLRKESTVVGSVGSNTTGGQPLLDIAGNATNGNIRFLTANTEVMRINSSKRVGIGVNPSYKFQILETGGATTNIAAYANVQGTGTNNYAFYADATQGTSTNFAFYGASGNNYFAGDTGVGTDAPTAKLQVDGDIKIGSGAGSGQDSNNMTIQVSNSTYGDTANLGLLIRNNGTNTEFAQIGFGYSESRCPVVIGSVITSGASATKGDFIIGTRSTTTGSDAPSERFRVTSDGEVCVGGTARNNGYNSGFRTLVVESVNTDTASIIELVGTRGVGGNQNGMIHFINKNASAVETARIAGINGASSVNEGALQFMTRTAATSLSEKMQLTGDGYLRMASGTGGIQFGGDTAVANALDDYEEGTFTPVIGDGTYTFQNIRGHYFKIGRMVHIHIGLRINAATPGTATASISGLPYASETTGSYQEPHTRCGVAGNCVTANLSNNLGFFIVNGTAVLNARSSANNADTPVTSDDLWQGNTFIKFQMIYSTS